MLRSLAKRPTNAAAESSVEPPHAAGPLPKRRQLPLLSELATPVEEPPRCASVALSEHTEEHSQCHECQDAGQGHGSSISTASGADGNDMLRCKSFADCHRGTLACDSFLDGECPKGCDEAPRPTISGEHNSQQLRRQP